MKPTEQDLREAYYRRVYGIDDRMADAMYRHTIGAMTLTHGSAASWRIACGLRKARDYAIASRHEAFRRACDVLR